MSLDKQDHILNNGLFINKKGLILADKLHPLNKKECSICGDPGQIELHDAPAIVLNCMDFRLRDNLSCHLDLLGYRNKYDEVIAAGSSLGYNGLFNFRCWDIYLDQHIQLAYNLHNIHEIIVIDHMHCGLYNAQYNNGIQLPNGREYNLHVMNLRKSYKKLYKKFNPCNGTVLKIPNLKIKLYILSIDACRLTPITPKSEPKA